MSHLLIYYSLNRKFEFKKVYERAQVLSIPGINYNVSKFSDNGVIINLLRIPDNISQPVKSTDDNFVLMMDGEIYNKEDLIKVLGDISDIITDPEVCLIFYRKEGDEFVKKLNGQFNVVIYSIKDRELKIFNDRVGYRPFFYYIDDEKFIGSCEMKGILALWDRTLQIDPVGLLEIFAFGHNTGQKTYISSIYTLPPGSVLRIKNGILTIERYWKFRFKEDSASNKNEMEYVEELIRLSKKAVARRMKGEKRIGISLSGGLDSRLVAASINPEHLPIFAYTFGHSTARDVLYAKEISKILNFKHKHFTYPQGYLSACVEKVVWRNEGCFPFYDATSPFFHKEIKKEIDIILTGHCGDILSGGHLRSSMKHKHSLKQISEMIFHRALVVDEKLLQSIFTQKFFKSYWQELKNAFFITVKETNHDNPFHIADVWDMENRQHRYIFHSPQVDRYLFEIRAPLLDNEIIDFFLELPLKYRIGQRVYKKAIVFGFPKIAKVPWAYTGRPIQTNPYMDLFIKYWNYGIRICRSFASRMGLIDKALALDYRDVGSEMREDRALFDKILYPFLESDYFLSDIFNKEGIKMIIQQHLEGKQDHTHIIGTLITFAVAYKFFFVNSSLKPPPFE